VEVGGGGEKTMSIINKRFWNFDLSGWLIRKLHRILIHKYNPAYVCRSFDFRRIAITITYISRIERK
jgi:hypothetical protein